MIAISQILLGLLLLGLFTAMFYACFSSTKGPLSILNLKGQLLLLKAKFESQLSIDPDKERRIMEDLQNKAKTSCSGEVISANKELRALFLVTCQCVNGMITSSAPSSKTSWLRYGALMNDFNEQYFIGKKNGELQPQ